MSISTFLNGLGYLFGKIPLQDRKERWKNELENLEREKNEILISKADVKKAKRVTDIDKRIAYLNQLLKNSSNAN